MKYCVVMLLVLICSLLCSCSDNEEAGGTFDQEVIVFEDGFESENSDLTDLFPSDESRWTNIQIVNPENQINELLLESQIVLSGNNALKILSNKSGEILSKVDIEKGGFSIPVGSQLFIEANFFIATEEKIKNLFLIDLECCSCWDPGVPDNQCPGIRLIMGGEDDYLSIERGKILNPTIRQTKRPFPRNEWVNVRWEMTLSQGDDGANSLFINGEEVISEPGVNMPNGEVFRDEFARNGITFQLQEPLFYERVQVRATANASSTDVLMYLDDFKLRYQEPVSQ